MDDDTYVPIEGVNPYFPGSDAWHRWNLGIPLGVLGYVGNVTSNEDGIVAEGWWFGDRPPSAHGWSVGFRNGEIDDISAYD